ncbi:uncharacterized protein LOC141817462 [Curcuma longa]|uniref:uncharacterized protein LOC141817462 n=1 Tax=Curcuma longa TaxID=136217 RepID=UPI003D9DE563
MLKMLRPEIALSVAGGVHRPQTAEELFSSALNTEHYLKSINQQNQALTANKNPSQSENQKPPNNNPHWKKNHNGKRKPWNKSAGGSQGKKPRYPPCANCGKMHLGTCLLGLKRCFICGKEGHFARGCPTAAKAPQQQYIQHQGAPPQLHQMQAAIDGTHICQGQLEVPPATTNARVFSLTKEDVATASTVVTDMICHCKD